MLETSVWETRVQGPDGKYLSYWNLFNEVERLDVKRISILPYYYRGWSVSNNTPSYSYYISQYFLPFPMTMVISSTLNPLVLIKLKRDGPSVTSVLFLYTRKDETCLSLTTYYDSDLYKDISFNDLKVSLWSPFGPF